jgi:hypothetical protein
MDTAQTITASIAGGGLIVATLSLYRTWRLQRQQMRLQAKQEELIDLQLEALRKQTPPPSNGGKADIRVDLQSSGSSPKFVNRHRNIGDIATNATAFSSTDTPTREAAQQAAATLRRVSTSSCPTFDLAVHQADVFSYTP